ncbi:MAG: aminotransferase [bacterium (Candidatus Stahlbacteria) CG08_land_8_20_14_0_20_40_26]|nr:MAG: aminotransferase [bacterium (Candidatus Stahlbacteria) CG23_combo_of_CG06-09_8_20_14_all_40_9]PIS25563.1 MAG: aminotransferase [bacterium (Candidatus Stahlbacteria) CG08_land_8_20_14_0_20_40_26]
MLEDKLSTVAKAMKRSEIRELLKLVAKPEIISFAGGMPDPTLFPSKLIAEVTSEVMEKEGERALQYGPTEGDTELREKLAEWDKVDIDNILITTASQQGLDLVSKIFIDPGDTVIVGYPTYLGGLQAFNSYDAKFIGIPLDDEGMKVDVLEGTLQKLSRDRNLPKFIYIVPDFQNPKGVTMPTDRRKRVLELASKYDLLILSDTPYRPLRYSGEPCPNFFHLDGGMERVITLFTFSKILCPGFRLGYIVAPPDIIDKLVVAKQGTDLCTSPFNQAIVREIIKQDKLDRHIKKLVSVYKEKRDRMLSALDNYMPKMEGLSWTRPDGGLFLWLTLPEGMDANRMFERALASNVAYVVGSAFHYDGNCKNTMRLNFSYPTLEKIDEGIKRLAKVIEEEAKEVL